MMGSPPSLTASLPSFSFMDDSQPRPADDTDFLPSWSRTLSPSPRLLPTTFGTSGASDSTNSPTKTGENGLLGADGEEINAWATSQNMPDVGIGLSPVLAPTHMNSSLALDAPSESLGGPARLLGGAYDYGFKKFHPTPAAEAPPPLQPRSIPPKSPAPLSFANVAALPSMSPTELQAPVLHSPPEPPAAPATPHSPVLSTPKPEEPSIDFAEFLTEGLQLRTTDGLADPDEPDTRVQAYAKLEFDHFDIYIQKLSVVIGRRPAGAAAARKYSLSSKDERKLEHFMLVGGAAVKEEETLPTIPLVTPPAPATSAKGKEKATDDPFSEFVKSSPPLVPSITVAADIAIPSISLPPAGDSIQPAPSTSAVPIDSKPTPATPARSQDVLTDIDLGPVRAVSRQHGKLYFEYEVGGWVLEVLGRNGVVIEGNWRAKGTKTLLLERTKIQIADRIFHFVLPSIDVSTVVPLAGPSASAKAKGRGKGKGKGKGKMRARADDASSSLSEVSDSDVELSPLQTPSVELAPPTAIPPPAAATLSVSPVPPSVSPAPPPHSPAPKSASPALVPVPRATSVPTAAPASTLARPSRSPLPRQASINALSLAPPPRAASKGAVYTASPAPPPRAASQESVYSEEALELGRQRAEMVAQLLAARQYGGKVPPKRGGKGKGVPRPPPGKGLGKGKGLPPRPRRVSNASWDDEDDEEDESDEDSDESDEEMADVSLDGLIGLKGKSATQQMPSVGKIVLKRAPSQPTPPPPAPAPLVAKKQPKRNRDPNLAPPSIAPTPPPLAVAPAPAAAPVSSSASPLPSVLPALPPVPSNSLPALPTSSVSLPALPPRATPSPAVSATTPLLSTDALPPLPPLAPTATTSTAPLPAFLPSSLPPAVSGPPAPAPTLATRADPYALPPPVASSSTAPAPAALPAAAPAAPSGQAGAAPKKAKARAPKAAGASTQKKAKTAAPPAPAPGAANETPSVLVAAPTPSVLAAPPTTSLPAASVTPAPAPIAPAAPVPAAAPKPRASPYTPAAYPPGAKPPDAAPADNPMAKPPYTYASLIAQAVSGAENKKLTLNGIYDWITARWPYFRDNQNGWQNSIRHNLTPARGFLKVPRRSDEPGKGAFWTIDPAQLGNFDGYHFRKVVPAAPSTKGASVSPAPGAVGSPAGSSAAGARPSPSPAPSGSTAPPASANATLAKPLPIVVAPIPDSYVRPAPPPDNGQPTDELTASLLADPPIVLHEGKLILNPGIFSHLTEDQLKNLQGLPASNALQILQAYVVQHFKEKMRKAAAEKAAKAKAAGGGGAATAAKPAGTAASATKVGQSAASTSSAGPSTTTSRPAGSATKGKATTTTATKAASSSKSAKREREPDIDLTGPPAKVVKASSKK